MKNKMKNNQDLIGLEVKITIKDSPYPKQKNGIYLGENDKWMYLEIKGKTVRFNLSEIKRLETSEDD